MTAGIVHVVDDDQAVRASLELLIRSVGLSVKTFSSAQAFLENYQSDETGCLVLDIRMPGMSGLELQRHLKGQRVDIPIIIISGHGDVPIAVRAMKDGALEFLEKPFSKQLLLEHIRYALKRDEERRAASQNQAEIEERLASLTNREHEIMQLIVAGKISKQIAAELGISKKTVDVHRARVMQKMKVDSLPQLVELTLARRQMSCDV